MLHAKADGEKLASELNDFLSQRLDAETRAWAAGPFTKLVEEKSTQLKDDLQTGIEDFFVSLDQVKFDITNAEGAPDVNEVPTWQRVACGVAGTLFLSPYAGLIGASTGFNLDFLKGMGLVIAGGTALALVGLSTPLALLIATGATSAISLSKSTERVVEQIRSSVVDGFCNNVNENGEALAHTAVASALEALGSIKDAVKESLGTELSETQQQVEGIIAEMEQGEENVRAQQAKLDDCEKQLRETADQLDSFIFDLVKNG